MSYCDSQEDRFHTQLYRHYIEQGDKFKNVDKATFEKCIGQLIDKKQSIECKDSVYKLADEKVVCYNRYGRIIGEYWIENEIYSYWVDKEYFI